jgi:protein SCO1/2
MRNRLLLVFCWFTATVLFLSGCQNAKRYRLKGDVISKKNATNEVEVKHEAIPNFMPAMTMTYKVPDSNAVAALQPGDAIEADVVVPKNGDPYWLDDVTITNTPQGPIKAALAPRLLMPGDSIPDVAMTNQDGQTIHLSQFKGKAVLVSFIYTRCPQPNFCPRTSSQFAYVHDELAKKPKDYDKTHLLSISLDPGYDTAPVLRKYGLAYMNNDAAGFAHWDFAATSPNDLATLAKAFGLEYFQQDNQIVHSMNTVLLGPDGNVARSWEGNEWKTGDALAALQDVAEKQLADEKHYQLKGAVTAVDKSNEEITVKHSAIPGYMAAMTMPYKVKDAKALDALTSGDRIHADLTVNGSNSYLENIVVDKHTQGKN